MGPVARPASIRREETAGQVTVAWTDGHTSRYEMRALRRSCPCAGCRDEREDTNPLRLAPPAPAADAHRLDRIQLVGRYALQFIWGDGHDAGIYSYDYLRSLCPCEECASAQE